MGLEVIVAHETGAALLEKRLVCGSNDALFSAFPTRTGAPALLIHLALEAFAVNRESPLAGHVLLLVERQPIGVVELECHGSRQHRVLERFHFFVKNFFRNQERGCVAVLFLFHHASHALDALHQLGIAGMHHLCNKPGELIEKRVFDAHHVCVPQGAAHDLAEHVTTAFI